MKSSSKKVIGPAKLSLDELKTVIVEIAATLNSRPLTYIYPEVGEEALTPSYLMLGKRLSTLPFDRVEEEDDPDYHSKEAFIKCAKSFSLKVEKGVLNRSTRASSHDKKKESSRFDCKRRHCKY